MVLRLEWVPDEASGINSYTTTYIIAPAAKAIQEATEGMVPSQEQVDQWMQEEFDYRNSDEYLE